MSKTTFPQWLQTKVKEEIIKQMHLDADEEKLLHIAKEDKNSKQAKFLIHVSHKFCVKAHHIDTMRAILANEGLIVCDMWVGSEQLSTYTTKNYKNEDVERPFLYQAVQVR